MLNRVFFAALAAVALTLAVLITVLPTPQTGSTLEGNSFAVTNVRVFDGQDVHEASTVVVSDGRIARMGSEVELPANIPVIDGSGQTLMPGLIDAHIHNYGEALASSLRFGVTTSVDMFSAADALPALIGLRDGLTRLRRADVFSAGMLATAAGGHGTQFGVPVEPLSGPEQADAWVAQRLAEGSDFIKLVYIPGQTRIPSLDLNTASAVITAAHAHGLQAVAHISTQQAALDLMAAGVDGFVHIFADVPVTEAFVRQAVESDVFVVPTLSVLASASGHNRGAELAQDEQLAPFLDTTQTQMLSRSLGSAARGFDLALGAANTYALHQAGVPILAGSDAPNPGTAFGASIHQEIALLAEAGLTPAAALAAATRMPAAAFGMADRGVLAVGARADLILVEGNPLQEVLATRAITHVFKNGYVFEREAQSAVTSAPLSSGKLSNFETTLAGADELAWAATDDGRARGNSTASIERLEDSGAEAGSGALYVNAEVRSGFFAPWAGAYFGEQSDSPAPRDISGYRTLQFSIRGTPGSYRAMLFNAGAAGAPPTVAIQVTESWQRVSLPLADFAGFNAGTFGGLAIVAGPGSGAFEFYLDRVRLVE